MSSDGGRKLTEESEGPREGSRATRRVDPVGEPRLRTERRRRGSERATPRAAARTRGTPRTAGHRGRRDTEDGAAVVKPNGHRMESTVLLYPDTRPRAAQGSVPEATAKPLVAPGHPENLADHRDKAGSQLPEPGGREGTQGPSTARKAGFGGLLRSTCSAAPAETGRPSTCLVRVTSGASCSRGGQLQARKDCTLG
ncbi:translation initiation factor IF-2-like [Lynx rufus]|uniref:translation initiation factor IF-2-like n=1 Tax=Lynx rufus TaxID=61384 RepID=UPI001F127C88|nr:translation initiation factor IF-2-like [Lynx rufus]